MGVLLFLKRSGKECDPGGRLRDRDGAPSRRPEPAKLASRSRGNLDGPVEEDPGRWSAQSRRTPGGEPGREGTSGCSSGCTVIRWSVAGLNRTWGSGCARRLGSEEGSCCAAHVLTSAVPSAGAAALGRRGGTGRLPVNAAAPPSAAGRPLTRCQERWFRPKSPRLEFGWRQLHQVHPQRPEVGGTKEKMN